MILSKRIEKYLDGGDTWKDPINCMLLLERIFIHHEIFLSRPEFTLKTKNMNSFLKLSINLTVKARTKLYQFSFLQCTGMYY